MCLFIFVWTGKFEITLLAWKIGSLGLNVSYCETLRGSEHVCVFGGGRKGKCDVSVVAMEMRVRECNLGEKLHGKLHEVKQSAI